LPTTLGEENTRIRIRHNACIFNGANGNANLFHINKCTLVISRGVAAIAGRPYPDRI